MNQDEEHLRLLSIFHYVVGAITGLIGCLPFIHVGIGLAVVTGALDGPGKEQAPAIIGWLFVVAGGMAILMMWSMATVLVMAGRRLSQRRSHTFCIVVAALACTMFPFGTVLGIFTLIVLLRPSVKQLFGVALPP
jgi:hypothetical protein